MAPAVGHACVPVAFPAAVPGRMADPQRLRLLDPEPDGRTMAAIPGTGVHLLQPRPPRGAGTHAVAPDQGCHAAGGRDGSIVGGWRERVRVASHAGTGCLTTA